MSTVAPSSCLDPAGGSVLATVPALPPAGTSFGTTFGTKPASLNAFSAAATVRPRTSGTASGLPAETEELGGGKFSTGTPTSAPFIAACQMGPGMVAPKTRG